jgi:Mycotoxin biosynthesis protein UstYa
MLRHTYYAALSGTLSDLASPEVTHDQNHRADPHHVRHCFDYLRQSLVCAADSNLEPVDVELGGVTGWGFERTCRDFEGVKEWAGRWWSSGDEKSTRPRDH